MHFDWLKGLFDRVDARGTKAPPKSKKRQRARLANPVLEELETRVVPASISVIAAGTDGLGEIVSLGADTYSATTLRAAINYANETEGDDSISLPAGTFTLTSELAITDSVTIIGVAGTTIDGNHSDRIFDINGQGTSSTFVTLDTLTLQNGQAEFASGAIRAQYVDLTIINSNIVDNEAVAHLGGGNRATGGAIYSYNSHLFIDSSTISYNEARSEAGVPYDSQGGGIHASSSELTTHNSTISHNTSRGADGTTGNGAMGRGGGF